MIQNSDWEKLSKEQRSVVNAWRDRAATKLRAEAEAFDREHPELYLTWQVRVGALIRADHRGLERPADPLCKEDAGIPTGSGMLNTLISFMEQLATSGMEHKDIIVRGYDYALLLCRAREEHGVRSDREMPTRLQIHVMDYAADLLKAAVGKGIEAKQSTQ